MPKLRENRRARIRLFCSTNLFKTSKEWSVDPSSTRMNSHKKSGLLSAKSAKRLCRTARFSSSLYKGVITEIFVGNLTKPREA